jgi:ATP-dependent exoDNAse (exonuclease V) beta subunit
MLKIYRSSAGSGKTFTLVREYLQICMKSKEVDKYRHILAITFTNKACNEMKDRIIRTLVDFAQGVKEERGMYDALQKEYRLDADYIIDYSKKMLDSILQDYSSFSISTIDSFIHRVIRSFAYELDIPHQFEVHMDKEELIENVISTLLDEINETSDSPIVQSLLSFADQNMEDNKGWNIEYSLKNFAKELLKENNMAFLNKLSELDYNEIDTAQKRMQQSSINFEKTMHEQGKKVVQLMKSAGVNDEDFFQKGKGVPSYINKLLNFDSSVSLEIKGHVDKTINEDKWHGGKNPAQDSRIDSIKDQLKALILDSQNLIQTEGKKYYLFQIVLSNIFQVKVADGISKALQKVKEEGNILPIHEFQHIISKIVSVQDAPVIYERIGEKYDNILIDEFQDTSTLQFRNLLPLIENSQFKSAESLIVGDAKQSIYRFKGGEALQLVELPNIFGSDDDEMLKAREVAINNYPTKPEILSSNFRSKREIIEFNNKFYDCLKNSNESLKKIYMEHEQLFLPEKVGGYVRIEQIDDEDNQAKKFDKILEIIEECKAHGYSAGDVAILTRDNKTAVYYAENLLGQKFEVETGESLLFIDSPDVRIIESLILFCSAPLDKMNRYDLLSHSGLDKLLEQQEISSLIRANLPVFNKRISELISREFATANMMHYTPYAIAVHACKLFSINTKDAFVSAFLDLIVDSGAGHAADFVFWWAQFRSKRSIQTNSKNNAVKIMTLHKSKGLQFPVVIMPDTDWMIKPSNKNAWIVDDADIGISPMLVNLSARLSKTDYASFQEEENLLSDIDNVNLLYVGTTRPEDRLYIMYEEHKSDGKSKYADNFITAFLSNEKTDSGIYTFGSSDSKKQIKEKASNSESRINRNEYSLSGIELSLNQRPDLKSYIKQELNEEQEYGNQLHELLSKVAENGLEYALNRLNESDLNVQQIRNDITYIVNDSELKRFFTNDYQSIAEYEILAADKKVLKPDLLAIKRGTKTVSIIDYKTGKPMKEHEVQVNEYASLLQMSGYEIEERLIVYTQTKEIKRL